MRRMGYRIIFVKIILLSGIITLHAQQTDILYKLYENGQVKELRSTVSELQSKYPNNLEVQFFSTLFAENGDEAIKILEDLIKNANGKLKKIIAKKIAEYYYAKGYYLSANRYQKIALEETNEIENVDNKIENYTKPAVPEIINFVIQVGAFSHEDNAIQLIKMLGLNNISSKIVTRKVNSNVLYCVWIDGKSNFEQTNEYANSLKNKYRLEYRIIKP